MDILRLLPKDVYDAAVGANSPSASNVFATILDLTNAISLTPTFVPYAATANSLGDTSLVYNVAGTTFAIGTTAIANALFRFRMLSTTSFGVDIHSGSAIGPNKRTFTVSCASQVAGSHEAAIIGEGRVAALLGNAVGVVGVVGSTPTPLFDGYVGVYGYGNQTVAGRADKTWAVYGNTPIVNVNARNIGAQFQASGSTVGNHALITGAGNVGFGTLTPTATTLVEIDNGIAAATLAFDVLSSGGSTLFKVADNGVVTVTGKLTVTGLIDPTGLEYSQVATNPGGVAIDTTWISSGDGRLRQGSNILAYSSELGDGDGIYSASGALSGATVATMAGNNLTFSTVDGIFKVDSVGTTTGVKPFQVSVGTGGGDAISVEKTGAQNKIRLNDGGNWGELSATNYRMHFFSNQFDGNTLGVDKPVFAYKTSSNNYTISIGKLLNADIRTAGVDIERDIQGLVNAFVHRTTLSGTLVSADGNPREQRVQGIVSSGAYTNSGAGVSTKVGLLIDITGGDVNKAIQVVNGISEFNDDLEIIGGTDGIILEDTTLASRHRITLDNGALTISAAL